jgi:serine/threonine protein kinase
MKRLHTDKELLQQVIVARELENLGGGSAPGIPRPAELYSPIMPGRGTSVTPVIHSPEGVLPPIPDHILCRQIGRGAYGHVWLARDAIGTFHAVKIIYRNQFHDGGPFEREFRGIQKFTPISREHPGFVHILHIGRNDQSGYFYYIMELGDDESTGQKIDPENYKPKTLASERAQQGKLLVEQCIQLGLSLASALHHLHGHQLIHRDIKPANIIFVNNKPKFADIGLVTEMAATGEEISYVGTKGYAAPEGPGTPAADIYGLGKVLYEVITGLDRSHFPDLPTGFVADPNPALFPLNDIILKACDPDPAKRYTSAAVLHGDLLTLWQSVESAARVR